MTTTNTGGVRFEFDEEAEGTQAGKYADTGRLNYRKSVS